MSGKQTIGMKCIQGKVVLLEAKNCWQSIVEWKKENHLINHSTTLK